jgi:hypothetical protein
MLLAVIPGDVPLLSDRIVPLLVPLKPRKTAVQRTYDGDLLGFFMV